MNITSVADALSALRKADRIIASAISVLSRSDVEAVSGLPAEFAVALEARRTSWEARTMMQVADVLRTLPRLSVALQNGVVSWSQCRAIVRAIRDVRAEQRGTVDELIGRRAPDLVRSEPDRLVREVEDACARLRADLALKREQRRIERSFLVLRPTLDNGGSLYGEADAERFASIVEALDAFAETPVEGERGAQHMDALVRICESSLSGGGDTRPRPRMLATFDIDRVRSDGAEILWPLVGKAPRLTPLATEVAACDSDIVLVALRKGAPVAVGNAHAGVPARTRTAVLARDRGCRFPGCGAPAPCSEFHHIRWRSRGGTSVVENLIMLCRRCHRRVHTQGWLIARQPDGSVEFRRRGRAWLSARRE